MKISESQLKEIIREEVETVIEEGLKQQILMGAALIGAMFGMPADSQAAIQLSKDTIEDAGSLPISTDGGMLNNTTAQVIYGGLMALSPEKFPHAADAAKMVKKAHKSGKVTDFKNLPPIAQQALQIVSTQMQGAADAGPGAERDKTVKTTTDWQAAAPKGMKLKKKFNK